MDNGIFTLLATAFTLGLVHTATGPDHYLPFVAMAKTRNWTQTKTIWVVSICGFGHVAGSIILGIIGIVTGIFVGKLEAFEGMRGSLASWLLFGVGVIYTLWAIIHRIRKPDHAHTHFSDKASAKRTMTFWVLFTIFVFGPCEPLIPILMYPAAEFNIWAIALVSIVFAIATIGTMLIMTILLLKGISISKFHALEKYQHIMAGATLAICGASIIFLGL